MEEKLKVEELAEIVFLFNLALAVAGEACGKKNTMFAMTMMMMARPDWSVEHGCGQPA